MEKDEAIKILNGYMGGKIDPESTELYQAIELVVEILESKPSSNLDEAAQKVEDYYDVGEEHGCLCCHRGDIKDAFKAGAEWMARQGRSMVITPDVDWTDVDKFVYKHSGDNVIIQIRKINKKEK